MSAGRGRSKSSTGDGWVHAHSIAKVGTTPGAVLLLARQAAVGAYGGVAWPLASRLCLSRLDFDEDLPPLDVPGLIDRIRRLSQQLEATLQTARHGQLLRTGLQVRSRGGRGCVRNAPVGPPSHRPPAAGRLSEL